MTKAEARKVHGFPGMEGVAGFLDDYLRVGRKGGEGGLQRPRPHLFWTSGKAKAVRRLAAEWLSGVRNICFRETSITVRAILRSAFVR